MAYLAASLTSARTVKNLDTGGAHVHQEICAILSVQLASSLISSLPDRHAAMLQRHARYCIPQDAHQDPSPRPRFGAVTSASNPMTPTAFTTLARASAIGWNSVNTSAQQEMFKSKAGAPEHVRRHTALKHCCCQKPT